MTENTRRKLKVDKFLGEWCVLAVDPANPFDDGTVWLRGFDSKEQADATARRLQDAMEPEASELLRAARLVLALHDARDTEGPGGAVPGCPVRLDPKAEAQLRGAIRGWLVEAAR